MKEESLIGKYFTCDELEESYIIISESGNTYIVFGDDNFYNIIDDKEEKETNKQYEVAKDFINDKDECREMTPEERVEFIDRIDIRLINKPTDLEFEIPEGDVEKVFDLNILEEIYGTHGIDVEKDKPFQYQVGIDTFDRARANMTTEEIVAACKFNVDKYLWRKKNQDLSDIQKMRDYLDFWEEVITE